MKKLIKILSIDGGGIRGLIPALILQEIERRMGGKHLAGALDLMAGTSTGGIIALLLNTPDDNGAPKYQAKDIVQTYKTMGNTIFYRSFWQYLSSLNGWIREKYASKHIENSFYNFFQNAQLRNTLTNVIIPAYDISADNTLFFKTHKAKLDSTKDFYLRDIARATSAAPTYFKPAKIMSCSQEKEYTLIDGGVAVNNPTMSAVAEAFECFGRDNDFFILSLGTGSNFEVRNGKSSFTLKEIKRGGKLEWAEEIVPIMMYASSNVVDYQVEELSAKQDGKDYYRLQPLINSKHTTLDNTEPGNIKALERYAEKLIKTHQKQISYIVEVLTS